jgi:hypothetical protein
MDLEDRNILLFKCKIYEEIIKKNLNLNLPEIINNNIHLLYNLENNVNESIYSKKEKSEKVQNLSVDTSAILSKISEYGSNENNIMSNIENESESTNTNANTSTNTSAITSTNTSALTSVETRSKVEINVKKEDDPKSESDEETNQVQKQKCRYKKLVNVVDVQEGGIIVDEDEVNEKYKDMFETVKFDYEEYKSEFDQIMDNIKKNRVYSKEVENIRRKRKFLSLKLNNTEIIDRLNYEAKLLEKVLEEKNTHKKKIADVIMNKFMYPSELRRIMYTNSDQMTIEIDELKNLEACFKTKNCFKKELDVFNFGDVSKNLGTYEICLFSLDEFLKMILVNKYGHNNYVYVSLPKSKEDDPFGFYYLESKSDDKYYWKMDCRGEELACELRENLLNYTVKLYRDLYYLINHDNVYRENITKYSQVYEFELEQISQNMCYLCDHYKFCKLLQNLIINNCNYTNFITDNDLFNLYGDDLCQKKTFQKLSENKSYTISLQESVKSIYDDISDEQVEKFINLKMNNLK